MKGYREAELANFNCTFGQEDLGMAIHFMDVIYPALQQGYKRETKNARYYIDNVEIIEVAGLGYVLVGTHIYQTTFKKETDYDPEDGIMYVNEEIETSPYSAFGIILKNHRMIHIRNESSSPRLNWLGTTIRNFIEQYIKDKSLNVPLPKIDIVPIASETEIDQQVKKFERIKLLEFTYFPLNGDIDNSSFFDKNRETMEKLDSKNMKSDIKEPKNIENIIKLIKEGKDLVSTRITGINRQGNELMVTNNSFKEKIPLNLPEDIESIVGSIKDALEKLSGRKSLNEASKANEDNYKRYIVEEIEEDRNKDIHE